MSQIPKNQILDAVAQVYYEQEQLMCPIIQLSLKPASEQQLSKIYQVLAFEFDPEQYLYEEIDETDSKQPENPSRLRIPRD